LTAHPPRNPPRLRCRQLRCVVAAACLLSPEPAFAKGRFPESNEIIFSPSDPNLVIARTTYGILQSRDNGTTWQYLCEDALGVSSDSQLDAALGLTASGALVAGVTSPSRSTATYVGLDQSTDLGCSWNCIGGPLAQQAVADLVVRPDAPDVVFAVTSTYRLSDAGGAYSHVFQSTDDGANWSALGAPVDPSVIIQTISVARTDPSRIYLSGMRYGAQKTAALFVSFDAGAHWAERPLPMFDSSIEDSIWIAAVDPTDADRVYIRSSAPLLVAGKSRLFVTTDAGKSFQTILEFQIPWSKFMDAGDLLGFALSPDGSKVYAGSKEEGLFVAAKSDLTFRSVNSAIAVQCLATRGDELWACSNAVSGFIVGVSTDDGVHFCPKMREIANLTGPIACGAASDAPLACGATVPGSACQSSFDAFCLTNIGGCQADAGGPCEMGADSGSDAASGIGGRPKSSGCGCSTAASGGPGGLLALPVALVIVRTRRLRDTEKA
jgi:hypothetical protein